MSSETKHRSPTVRKSQGNGAKLRQKIRFLERLHLRTNDASILLQIQELKQQEIENPSTLYTSIFPEHRRAERADYLLEPIDLHSYLTLHPQRGRDRFGLPCYGPNFETPSQFYIDSFQMYRLFRNAPDYHLLPEQTRNNREYAILNNILEDCGMRLEVLDIKMQSAENILQELENLKRKRQLPEQRKAQISQTPEIVLEECIELDTLPDMTPIRVEAVESQTSLHNSVQLVCDVRDCPQQHQDLIERPKGMFDADVTQDFDITPLLPDLSDQEHDAPEMVEATPPIEFPQHFQLGNWASEVELEIPLDESQPSETAPPPTVQSEYYDGVKTFQSQVLSMNQCSWVDTLLMRYESG